MHSYNLKVKGSKKRQRVNLNRKLYSGKLSQVVAFDFITRTDYLIKSAPCGLACYCDAVIMRSI